MAADTTETTVLDRTPWGKFWFTPGDPSTLGLMRWLTGLMALYVFAVLTLDLMAFFGPDAYLSQAAVNRDRKEVPYVVSPSSWGDPVPNIRMPDGEHRRLAVVAFLRGLPGPAGQRAEALEYVRDLVPDDPESARQGLSFLDLMPVDAEDRVARLAKILTTEPNAEKPSTEIPPFITAMPPPQKARTRAAVERLMAVLPDDRQARGYVVQWLQEMSPGERELALEFIQNLPAESRERDPVIDYVYYWGMDPSQAHDKGRPVFSLWFHLKTPTAFYAVHFAGMAFVALFTVGLWTRVTSVVSLLFLLQTLHRSQQVLFGIDTMLNILMVYLTIGPSGAAYSLDRLLQVRRLRADIAAGRARATDPAVAALLAGPPKSRLACFATRLFQVHFCFIYTASGLSKLKGDAWWNHTALWYTLANPEFSPLPVPGYTKVWLEFLSNNRPFFGLFAAAGVVFTLALELGFAALVWTRLRPLMIACVCMLHVNIAVFMGLTGFSFCMMTLVLAYVPPEVIRRKLG